MAPQDDLTAERAATDMYNRLFSVMRLPEHEHHAKARLKLFYQVTRQEALREAMEAIEKCFENGPSTDLLTCGQQLGIRSAVIAVETLDRLASEGG